MDVNLPSAGRTSSVADSNASLLAHEPARGSTIDSPETDDETGPLWSLPHVVHSTPAERLREVLIRPDAMGADAFVVELTTAEARRSG